MTMKKVKLVVDLGNSQTRVFAMAYNNEGAKPKVKGFVLDNRFATIRGTETSRGLSNTEMYDESNSGVFQIDLTPAVKRLSGIFATGKLAKDNFQRKLLSPTLSANVPKADNFLVYLALVNAFDNVLTWLASEFGGGRTKAEVSDLIDFELNLLVPPIQKDMAQSRFAEVLGSGFEYKSLMSDTDIKVNISKVSVYEEGLMAYWAFVVSLSTMKPRQEYMGIASSRVLILDIGEGTTDIVAVDHNNLLDGVKKTIMMGSSNIVESVQNTFSAMHGLSLTDDMFNGIMENPTVSVGAKSYDVAEILEDEIGNTTDKLVKEVISYLKNTDIDLNSFEKLLVVGGGALSNGRNTSVADNILDYLQVYVPNIELVKPDELTEPLYLNAGIDLTSQRNLNLLGTIIRDRVEELRAK